MVVLDLGGEHLEGPESEYRGMGRDKLSANHTANGAGSIWD